MQLKHIKIDSIKVIENIRQSYSNHQLSELMASIKEYGLLQPIGVKETQDGYSLLWGYRRMSAFQKLGLKEITAVIFSQKDEEMDERDFMIINATENLQRKQINLAELGRYIDELHKTMSHSEIAVKLSIPVNRARAAHDTWKKLPERFKKKIAMFDYGRAEKGGDLAFTTAGAILRIKGITKEQKEKIFEYAVKNDLTRNNLNVLASLIAQNLSLSEALINLDAWKSVHSKIMINKKVLEKVMKKYGSLTEFIKQNVAKEYGINSVLEFKVR